MTPEQQLLRHVSDALKKLDPNLVGEVTESNGKVSFADGSVTVQGTIYDNEKGTHDSIVHCHFKAFVGVDTSGNLDACVVGVDSERSQALLQAAETWVEAVACCILSLVHGRPVLGATFFDGASKLGFKICQGFVGPLRCRGASMPDEFHDLAFFGHAESMSPPGMTHLAKVTVSKGENSWRRNIEIDGHGVGYEESHWGQVKSEPTNLVLSCYAVFHCVDVPEFSKQRQIVDDGIRQYVASFTTINDKENTQPVRANAIPEELLHKILNFTNLAFSRIMLRDLNIAFNPTYISVLPDGQTVEDQHLMDDPVYARSMALASEFFAEETLGSAAASIAATSPELGALNQALNAGQKPQDLTCAAPIIPDFGTTADVFNHRVAQIFKNRPAPPSPPKQPWWKFW